MVRNAAASEDRFKHQFDTRRVLFTGRRRSSQIKTICCRSGALQVSAAEGETKAIAVRALLLTALVMNFIGKLKNLNNLNNLLIKFRFSLSSVRGKDPPEKAKCLL